MRVELLAPDAPPKQSLPAADASAFANALGAVESQLTKATAAEDAFAHGAGSLQAATYERARADVALAVTTAAVQRAAQALSTVMNMQI